MLFNEEEELHWSCFLRTKFVFFVVVGKGGERGDLRSR